ncbi:MAG: nuclear transport factor 2 family protein [Pseudomonadota bacterium]|nr:nuclear transport factor 2 family protein [Pseudomonadota bacterium]
MALVKRLVDADNGLCAIAGMNMDSLDTKRFAADLIAAWISHDLDRILSHYGDDITLSSAVVGEVTGSQTATLTGKSTIRKYWHLGLAWFPDLLFELINAFPGARSVVLPYRSVSNRVATGFVRFNVEAKICEVHAPDGAAHGR